jgi:hypothetical protein
MKTVRRLGSITGTKVALCEYGGPQALNSYQGRYLQGSRLVHREDQEKRRAAVHIAAKMCVKLTKVIHCYTSQILLNSPPMAGAETAPLCCLVENHREVIYGRT